MNYSYHAQKGVGMMEVLVSMLILTVAILGFVALQVQATFATHEALKRSDSMIILNGLAEKIRLNSSANYNIAIPTSAPDCLKQETCTPSQQAEVDLYSQQVLANLKFIKLGVALCPNTSSAQTRTCLIAAWDETNPTIESITLAEENYCLHSDGKYASKAHCLVLEAY